MTAAGRASLPALLSLAAAAAPAAYAQQGQAGPGWGEAAVLAGFAAAVAGVFLYLARGSILRRRTEYDGQDLGSKEDRAYEKYHSDWGDYYEEPGSRTARTGGGARGGRPAPGGLPDLYGVMGVPRDATRGEIKAQYRRLAKEIHPDRGTGRGSREGMARLNLAYEVLSDPSRREEYDRGLDG